ncbi:hypothetical protein [Bacillus cereus]|uniref:hypothetical protein n=1 Tax=Bacillus cereus TaxID=1396 RepID=UPI0020C1F4D5|nr:hypothetical protein [Bacillus cereus]
MTNTQNYMYLGCTPNGLTTPLAMYWSNHPYNLLHDAYPDRFTQEVIKAYKRIQQLRPIIPQDVEFCH